MYRFLYLVLKNNIKNMTQIVILTVLTSTQKREL